MLKKLIVSTVCAAGLISPAMAQQLSKEQLLQLAVERGTCGAELVPVDAVYRDASTITVTCGEATGFIPVAAGLGAAGGAAAAAAGLALLAAGGGGSNSTVTTPSTN